MISILHKLIALLLVVLFFLSACSNLAVSTPGPLIPGLAETLAAETLTAQQSVKFSLVSPVPQQSPQEASPSYQYPPTSTPELIETTVPQLTPFQNSIQLSSAAQSTEDCLNAAEFIKDISVPDFSPMKAGQRFIKTWQLKNSGTCTWTPDYALVFVWGNRMSGVTPKPLGRTVTPGQVIEVSTEMQAPIEPGDYQGSWIFQDANGNQFGTGYQGKQFFWVAISVQGKNDRYFGGDPGGCKGGG
jgi:hypothetical protein